MKIDKSMLKVGQRWRPINNKEDRGAQYFDVISEEDGEIIIKWNHLEETRRAGGFTWDYVLDETSAVELTLLKYDTD
jgi:hypothetical protein